jgi:hypothetical protein
MLHLTTIIILKTAIIIKTPTTIIKAIITTIIITLIHVQILLIIRIIQIIKFSRGFKLNREQVKIDSDFSIYKVSKRVFLLDKIEICDQNTLKSIVSFLDLGGKFIPCYHNNPSDIMCSFVKQFDPNLINFNNKLFFDNNKREKIVNLNSNNNNDDTVTENNFKSCINNSNSCFSTNCILENLKFNVKTNKINKFFISISFIKKSLAFRLNYFNNLSNA